MADEGFDFHDADSIDGMVLVPVKPDVHAYALRQYARQVEYVWVPWTDSDLSELATAAAKALEALADRIEFGG